MGALQEPDLHVQLHVSDQMVVAFAFGICQSACRCRSLACPQCCGSTFHLLKFSCAYRCSVALLCTPVALACPHGIQVWCIRGLLLNASPCMRQCCLSGELCSVAHCESPGCLQCHARVIFCATNAVPCHRTVLHMQQAHCQATSAEACSRTM